MVDSFSDDCFDTEFDTFWEQVTSFRIILWKNQMSWQNQFSKSSPIIHGLASLLQSCEIDTITVPEFSKI